MSTFLDTTRPLGGLRYLVCTLITGAVAFGIGIGAFDGLVIHHAGEQAEHHIAELKEAAVTKIKFDLKKKLPKGEKPDDKKLLEEAEAVFKTDAKAHAKFERDAHEARHHATAGAMPLAIFFAIVGALFGGLTGAMFLIRRAKDAALPPILTLLFHGPAFAFHAMLAFLALTIFGIEHAHGGFSGFMKEHIPAAVAASFAALGLLVHLILTALPGGKAEEEHSSH